MRSWNCCQASLAQRLDDECEHGRVVLLAVGRGERLDAGLAELARDAPRRRCPADSGRPGRCSSSAPASSPRGMARQVQPAGRHREVGAQAQLLAVGIGEDVGARAQALAEHVEEQSGRLDHGRRHLLVAGARESPHQALRLALQGLELLCGFRGHRVRYESSGRCHVRACLAASLLRHSFRLPGNGPTLGRDVTGIFPIITGNDPALARSNAAAPLQAR